LFLVCGDRPLETTVLLAWDEANLSKDRKFLLGLGGFAKRQIEFTEMSMRAAVAAI